MLRFEIGSWEAGEKIGQTDRRIFVNFDIDKRGFVKTQSLRTVLSMYI